VAHQAAFDMTDTTVRLPGDPTAQAAVASMIRVDHAGEYAAVRIYQGQLAALRARGKTDLVRHMLAQEQHHLETFDDLIADRRVRPTALLPVWHIAGFALGALTAALGERSAMACTVAVEETIDAHYQKQIAALDQTEPDLRATLSRFRDEELEHRDTGIAHGAEQAPGYRLLRAVIKTGCRAAIALSERI
jgi:ubiquinone biosynthesis monooxygenase Coq7